MDDERRPDIDRERLLMSRLEGWGLPEEARQTLLAALRSPTLEVRREAVEMLWDTLDDELATEALRLAREDSDEELRALAAISLAPGLRATTEAEWDDPEDPPPLSELAYDRVRQGLRALYYESATPRAVRRRALEAAVQAPDNWQEGAVRAAYASDDPDWRATAIFCMGHLPGFEAELLEALASGDVALQLEAVRAAAAAELCAAGPRVLALAMAASADPAVRQVAVQALPALAPPAAVESLSRLARGADPDLAAEARDALSSMGVYLEQDED
jgi:hypothetical protein